MAGPFYVDDGGNNTTGLSWANAFTSINSLQASVTLASDEIVYFGADSQCQAVNSASLTITGPTSGTPVKFISATVGTTNYSKGTSPQIDTSEATSYDIVFDGSFALYGMFIKSGRDIFLAPDTDEYSATYNCTFAIGATGTLLLTNTTTGISTSNENITLDLSADGTTTRTTGVLSHPISSSQTVQGLTFVNAGYRTGTVFTGNSMAGENYYSGVDLSGFTNATACEIFNLASFRCRFTLSNSKTASTWTPFKGAASGACSIALYNVGPADDPSSLITTDMYGSLVSSNTIYRSSGGTVEGVATSWLITTLAICCEAAPFYTPWIYDALTTTGSKTFTIYLTNDSLDFNNSEIWLDLDYLSTANSSVWTRASSHRATITTTPAALTSDGTSTWNGSGPSFTYKRKVAVTVTIGEEGQYRARLAVARTSVASSAYLYVDPKVVVS